MTTLLTPDTKAIVQGITGHQGEFHTKAMMDFGTKVVGGVTPGKAGQSVNGVMVYDDVDSAVKATGANSSVLFVPAPFTKDAAIEAIDAGIKLLVIITEHVPASDMVDLQLYARLNGARIVGPNCPGIATPGVAKLGIIPNMVLKKGSVGVVSRSGTLTYEIVNYITSAGLGESTVIGIGGDKVNGTSFIDALKLFKDDQDTSSIVLVGEIGGNAEEDAADFIRAHVVKPVVAFIAGLRAPPGKRMGHAGAIISGKSGTAEAKISSLEEAGVYVAKTASDIQKFLLERR